MKFNRTSPLPAPGRGVPSLRGGVREHNIALSGSRWLKLIDAKTAIFGKGIIP